MHGKQFEQKARVLLIASEPTRLRILYHLYNHKEACVNELAQALDTTIACTSHHLQSLKEHGLVRCERRGQTQCYCIAETELSKKLKPLVCG